MAINVENYHLPRYREIPDVGLYLEQTVKYINNCLRPLGCMEITASMVSNYVKKGIIERPYKKQYSSDQIAHLLVIALAKNVLSLEHIQRLFQMQQQVYENAVAYDYFCCELENMLRVVFGLQERAAEIGVTNTDLKRMLRSTIIAIVHIIYLNERFNEA